MQISVCVQNNVPNTADASSRLETFAHISVSPKSSHYHTFYFSAYMITIEADQSRANKWEVLVIYMGPSPHHAGSVPLFLNITTGNASHQFHVGHNNFFDTTRYIKRNMRAKINWQKLLVVDYTDTIEKKNKFKRASILISKTYYSSGFMHAVDLANQSPMFEGRSGNSVNPVPSNFSSPNTYIPDAVHNNITVPTSLEPPQSPQARDAPQVISNIAAPAPKSFTVPPGPSTAPPIMSSRGMQRMGSSRMKESIEGVELKISMFNSFQSTY